MIEQHQWLVPSGVSEDSAPSAEPSLVVGIGAADGSLDALKAFFIALDESAGMTFVIAQHLDKSGRNVLPEILMQFTELRVKEIRGGDRIEPDHIYVAAPGSLVELDATAFVVSEHASSNGQTRIDALFRSIAHGYGPRGAGIVLSGLGRDGTRGAQAISKAGGLTLACDPARAKFDAMPRAAIESGAIDQVLSPFEMADALLARATAVALDDLSSARENLEHAVDDLKLANEELRRLNRELLSIHGKLHESIQDLQSSLDAVRARNEALVNGHTNLSSLLRDSALGLLFLDPELHVVSYTGDIERVYAIEAGDVGRPIAELTHRAHDMPPLPHPADLRSAERYEEDVVTRDSWYVRRTLPHFSDAGALLGVIVAFIDVTKLKSSEAAAQPHEEWLRAITDRSPAIISMVDDALQSW